MRLTRPWYHSPLIVVRTVHVHFRNFTLKLLTDSVRTVKQIFGFLLEGKSKDNVKEEESKSASMDELHSFSESKEELEEQAEEQAAAMAQAEQPGSTNDKPAESQNPDMKGGSDSDVVVDHGPAAEETPAPPSTKPPQHMEQAEAPSTPKKHRLVIDLSESQPEKQPNDLQDSQTPPHWKEMEFENSPRNNAKNSQSDAAHPPQSEVQKQAEVSQPKSPSKDLLEKLEKEEEKTGQDMSSDEEDVAKRQAFKDMGGMAFMFRSYIKMDMCLSQVGNFDHAHPV